MMCKIAVFSRACVAATGSEEKLDSQIRLLEPYGIIELVKTGLTAMQRGSGVWQ